MFAFLCLYNFELWMCFVKMDVGNDDVKVFTFI